MAIGGFYGGDRPNTYQPKDTLGRVAPKKPGTYPGAILQGAQDYDEIMQRYRNIASGQGGQNQLDAIMRQYNQPYQRGPELAGAFRNLSELSKTGGLSESDKYNLRERGTSPIRSIYANADRNMQRQRSLQGGYSPNFNAASTKMARELSEQIGQQMTNVNAGIAEMTQRGRLSAAPQYGQLAQRETEIMNQQNQQRNTALQDFYRMQNQNKLAATEGMRGLYGTTPANAQLYGNQAIQQAQLTPPRRTPTRGSVTWMGNR
jgi:hypothetical protein